MMTVTEPDPMSRTTAIAYAVGLPLGLLALVFLPVGRLDWPPGWYFIAFVGVAYGASALVLARVNPAIYRARSRFQPGTKRWDMILLWLMLPAMVAEVPLATFDAGRMAWSVVPLSIIILGYLLLGAGIAVTTWAQAVNRFFEPGVRIQRERGQNVISSGPYATRLCRRAHDVRRHCARAGVMVGAFAGGLGRCGSDPPNKLGRCAAPGRTRWLC